MGIVFPYVTTPFLYKKRVISYIHRYRNHSFARLLARKQYIYFCGCGNSFMSCKSFTILTPQFFPPHAPVPAPVASRILGIVLAPFAMAALIVFRVMLRQVHTFVNLSRISSGTVLFSKSIGTSFPKSRNVFLIYILSYNRDIHVLYLPIFIIQYRGVFT